GGRPGTDGVAVLRRTTSSGCITVAVVTASGTSIIVMSFSILYVPTLRNGGRTVVSGGVMYAASGMSSKPTTLTSSGTRRPASFIAQITPNAIESLAAKTALTVGSLASRCPARYPDPALQ